MDSVISKADNPVFKRSPLSISLALLTAVKSGCAVILTLVALAAWSSSIDIEARLATAAQWEKVNGFAVFFPHANGNDLAEFENDGHITKLAEAGPLYEMLDAEGAIFVDASNYIPGIPRENPWLPASPIRINANYLDRYPIVDETGSQIRVSSTEQDWVVGVPARFKPMSAHIMDFLQATRTGNGEIDGAVQGELKVLGGQVPEQFIHQSVRIVWMADEQGIFSFNSTVNPDAANLITDPIVEIMTPANSLPVDRLNSITGELNTPLKVKLNGDSATTLKHLLPQLKKLNLDDNLTTLVMPSEALFQQIDSGRSAMRWMWIGAGIAVLLLAMLDIFFVIVYSDRIRRKLTVRRLHGFSFRRTYWELLRFVGISWIVYAAVTAVIVTVVSLLPGDRISPPVNALSPLLRLAPVVLIVFIFEILLICVTARIMELRSTSTRLKEL